MHFSTCLPRTNWLRFQPCFLPKREKKPFILLRNAEKYLDALFSLHKYSDCTDTVLETVQEFVCQMYGFKEIKSINEVRSVMFLKTYKTTSKEIFKQKLKNFDATALPACDSELQQHIRRTAYISQIWNNVHLKVATSLSPLDCGWIVDENEKYCFHWFSGDQLPQSIDEITLD